MSAMRDRATPHTVANSVRMSRSQHRGAFLIVEGSSDARIYENLIDTNQCHVIPAHKRDNVTGAVEILNQDSFRGALGIVDADFSAIIGVSRGGPNLLVTDSHDLETMMLRSPALEKVLREYGTPSRIASATTRLGSPVRDVLLDRATPIGCLRLLSETGNMHLKFQDLPFDSFVDETTLTVDVPALIKAVKLNSQKPGLFEASIEMRIRALVAASHDPWSICCGHDLVVMLSIGLRSLFGSWPADKVARETIERDLRLAYEREYFARTQLYSAIRAWEEANPPYAILRKGS